MGRSKLRAALHAEKGTDFKKLREQKKYKAALKEKKAKEAAAKGSEDESEDDKDNDDDDDEMDDGEETTNSAKDLGAQLLAAMAADSDDESDDDIEMEEKIVRKAKKHQPADDDDDEEDDDEDDDDEGGATLAYADIEAATKAATAQRQRRVIKSVAALTAALDRIRAADDSMRFEFHQSVLGVQPTAAAIEDTKDDTAREKQMYAQALAASQVARKRLRADKVPFSRPNDFFAEMVKDDGHMDRVKAKLIEAATAKKASAEARKQRELKKFGKQVQVEKQQERAKEKRDTLEKIKSLKRKRAEGGTTNTHEDSMFDVAIDKELSAPTKGKAAKGAKAGVRGGPPGSANAKRVSKNQKYGFGGKKKNSKSGDAMSSGDLSGFNPKRGGTGGSRPAGGSFKKQRPGKARRAAGAGRR